MSPPFRARSVAAFAAELDAFDFGETRLTGIHVHHTYRPDHETFARLGGRRCVRHRPARIGRAGRRDLVRARLAPAAGQLARP